MDKKMNVAVLCGGLSSEREVSLNSGKNVAKAVEELGYNLRQYDPATDLKKIIEDKDWIDVVFPVLHGKFGEDGTIQGFCELLDLPYVGSGILASALAMDKMKTIEVFKNAGLPVAKSSEIFEDTDFFKVEQSIGFPCVVKPIENGSSIGVEIVESKENLIGALDRVRKIGGRVMAEEYIKGREITVGVIGNDEIEALPVIEIKPKNKFYDYESKYGEGTKLPILSDAEHEIVERAQDYALRAHRALGCRGISRLDMILKDGKLFLLEINTLPGMTSHSLVPRAENEKGINFIGLIERLLDLALEGKNGVRQTN